MIDEGCKLRDPYSEIGVRVLNGRVTPCNVEDIVNKLEEGNVRESSKSEAAEKTLIEFDRLGEGTSVRFALYEGFGKNVKTRAVASTKAAA